MGSEVIIPYLNLETFIFQRFSWTERVGCIYRFCKMDRRFLFPFPSFLLPDPWAGVSHKKILRHSPWHFFTFMLY